MNRELVGIGVGSGAHAGIAIGRAHLLTPSELDIRQYTIERRDVLHEVARLNNAFSLVRAELEELRDDVAPGAPNEVGAFLDLHRMILDDPLLAAAPRDLVRSRLINAEWALTIQLEEVCRQFDAIDDHYFRERSEDVRQVVERVLRRLAGGKAASAAVRKPPADMLHLKNREDVLLGGFVTELGGPTSHTAILARSLGLPAVLGVTSAREKVVEGDLVVLDAESGRVVVNPDAGELAAFRERLRVDAEHRNELRRLKSKMARTRDGIAVEL